MNPKILVGCPTSFHKEYALKEYAQAIKYLIYNNYDYLFSLEQDVIPDKNILKKLISHNKKVISGIYFVHNIIDNKRILIPQAFIELKNKSSGLPDMRWLTEEEFLSNKL